MVRGSLVSEKAVREILLSVVVGVVSLFNLTAFASPVPTPETESNGTAGYFASRHRLAISGSTLARIPDLTEDSIRDIIPATRMPTTSKSGLQLSVFQAHDTNACKDDYYNQPLTNVERYTNLNSFRTGMPTHAAVLDVNYVSSCKTNPSQFGETFMRVRAATDKSGGIGYYAASGRNRLLKRNLFSISQVSSNRMNVGQSGLSIRIRPVTAVLPFSGEKNTMQIIWRQLVHEMKMEVHIKSAVIVNLKSSGEDCDALHSTCRISLYLMSLNWDSDKSKLIPGAKIYADPIQGGLPSVITPLGSSGTYTQLFELGYGGKKVVQSFASPTQNSLSPFDRVFKVEVHFDDNFINILKSSAFKILRKKQILGSSQTVDDVTDTQLRETFGTNALNPDSWRIEAVAGHTEFTDPSISVGNQNYIGTTFKWINLSAK